MHNAAFQYHLLPHAYSLYPSSTITDELGELVRKCDFGGASVTIPLKEQIFKLVCDLVSNFRFYHDRRSTRLRTELRRLVRLTPFIGREMNWSGIILIGWGLWQA